MKITVVCTSREHPIFPHLEHWVNERSSAHDVRLLNTAKGSPGGDILFLISCSELVRADVRSNYKHTLVVHASPLPEGRGWSPHVWQILGGSSVIPVTLLEAEDSVDSGDIWTQRSFELEGHELFEEINEKLFRVTLELMDFAIENAATIRPKPQSGAMGTYYRKRTPEDSRLDPDKTIAEQFDLLRVADTRRFPSFFEHRGHRYALCITKIE